MTSRYGMQTLDTDGNTRVELGKLSSGDYGLAVTDPLGVESEVWPVSSHYADGPITCDSTSYSEGTGSPSVTVYIGATGDAVVTVSAFIALTDANLTGTLGLSIDGGTPTDIASLGSTASIITANVASVRRLSDWTGTIAPSQQHTFTLQQRSSTAGVDVEFDALCLLVQPL